MKNIEKTMRSFRYDLNQILHDYRVEMMTRFRGSDLVDRVPKELWTEVCTGGSDQNRPQEKEMQKGKMVV